ncbi:MAG: DUF2358 domain-containing protein [Gloeocapsa sp. DLM2.Bin57]|nr:MAG: DUF2358 domain-containing protein [Gloeocapsa sp. DLM2.Bin57]
MDIIEILQQDYQKFPQEQNYTIYAANVYFKDPLNEFRGLARYQSMIQFIDKWFRNVKLDVHEIKRQEQQIDTEWTLSWNSPLPWQPRINISGRSELLLNNDNQIISHIDYWYCSPWDVLRQHFFS